MMLNDYTATCFNKRARARRGFTFVELATVIIIILLLIAISIPNFMEATTRAEVTRTKAEFSTIAHAVESYRADHHRYPSHADPRAPAPETLNTLTTPVRYLTKVPLFPEDWEKDKRDSYPTYVNLADIFPEEEPFSPPHRNGWALYSLTSTGPDSDYDLVINEEELQYDEYNPTNGTISNGDLNLFGP